MVVLLEVSILVEYDVQSCNCSTSLFSYRSGTYPPVLPAVHHPFVYGNPTPNQAEVESLRRLAIRYLRHPGAQVGMVGTGAGLLVESGGYKVVIILPDLF
jgi:hypothetical protein